MNDFIILGDDFTDFIKSEEDMKDFERMKDYLKVLEKPAKECIHEVLEFERIRRRLLGLPELKIIFQQPEQN